MTTTSFSSVIERLRSFWRTHGCAELCGYDMQMGAGTYHPATVFGVLDDLPRAFCYVQPSRRPQDGRYGESSNRLYQHHQFQVILKPAPQDAQILAYQSLIAVGLDVTVHDIKFIENNWESPVLGANGVGWEVWCDGMEILQYTYFEKMGGIQLATTPVEYAYGLERLSLILNASDSIMSTSWDGGLSYRDVRFDHEQGMSRYTFEHLDIKRARTRLDMQFMEVQELLKHDDWLAAYEALLVAVHEFNVLHGHGALGQAERANLVLECRGLAARCCAIYLKGRIQKDATENATLSKDGAI
jgi:glycyl-tRNA synthetase alpha chain